MVTLRTRCRAAATKTYVVSSAGWRPWIAPNAIAGSAAAVAEIAYMETLKTILELLRRDTMSAVVELAAAISAAYCQPKTIAAVTIKTLAIETSDLPVSSIDTGARSATSASPKKRRTSPAIVGDGRLVATLTTAAMRIGVAIDATATTYRKSRVGRPQVVFVKES